MFLFQREGDVFAHGHVRIQRIGLENHGDIPVLGVHIVAEAPVNVQFAARDFLKSCNHAQRGGLSASGRSDQNDEFLVGNFQIDSLNCRHFILVNLFQVFQNYLCHMSRP